MLTKTQIKIMGIFSSKIEEKFSIKQIAEMLEKPYPLIHRSVKKLIEDGFIKRDNKELLSLNYKANSQTLAFIESIRKEDFLNKNKTVKLLSNDLLKNINLDFFIFIIFGSSVEKSNPRDLDIIFIIENSSKINETEKLLNNISSNYSIKTDINVISQESANEMLSKINKINVMTEMLNSHIILFGAENYYRILKNAR